MYITTHLLNIVDFSDLAINMYLYIYQCYLQYGKVHYMVSGVNGLTKGD